MTSPIKDPDGNPIELEPGVARDDPDAIRADIEQTRAELADTVDALSAKLDVKAQAAQKAHELGQRANLKVEQAVAAAPPPVQQALGRAAEVTRPAIDKAAADKARTARITGAAVVTLLVLRRVRRIRRARRARRALVLETS